MLHVMARKIMLSCQMTSYFPSRIDGLCLSYGVSPAQALLAATFLPWLELVLFQELTCNVLQPAALVVLLLLLVKAEGFC